MATPDQISADILGMLDDIWSRANTLGNWASSDATYAKTYAQNARANNIAPTAFPFAPAVFEPNVYIPNIASTEVNIIQIEPLIERVMDNLRTEFTRFFDVYFPDECDYMAKTQAWLCNVIENGSTGIPANVEAQIYQRDRDRIEAEYQKAFQDANELWASRGFSLPGATLLARQYNLRQDADRSQAEASRNVAIKQVEIQLDMIKFAIQTAADLRTKAVQATAQYIGALATGMDTISKAIVVQQDAQSKLIAAASDFYRARISVEELKFKVEATEAEFKDKAAQRTHEQYLALTKAAVDAVVQGAQITGTQSAAALNALTTGASMNLGVSV
jgi:hypothetical protein